MAKFRRPPARPHRSRPNPVVAASAVLAVVINTILPWASAPAAAAGAGDTYVWVCTPHGLAFRAVPADPQDGPGSMPETDRGACPLCPGPIAGAAFDRPLAETWLRMPPRRHAASPCPAADVVPSAPPIPNPVRGPPGRPV